MSSNLVVFICIGICVLILIGVLFEKQVLSLLINGISGGMVIYCVNGLLPAYAVGINVLTLGMATVLGFPGVITLYVIKLLMIC